MKIIVKIAVSLASLALLAGCANQGKQASLADKSREVVTMKGFHMVQTELGKKKFVIDSEEANINPKAKKITFKIVTTKYYDKEKLVAELKSDTGLIHTDTNEIEAKGKVVLKTTEGSRLQTESLIWSSGKNKLNTEEFVTVYHGDNVMSGYGMESDLMLENVTIRKVTTKISDVESFKENIKK